MAPQFLLIGKPLVALRTGHRLLLVGEMDEAVLAQLAELWEALAAGGAGVAQSLLAGVHQRHVAPERRLVEVLVAPGAQKLQQIVTKLQFYHNSRHNTAFLCKT